MVRPGAAVTLPVAVTVASGDAASGRSRHPSGPSWSWGRTGGRRARRSPASPVVAIVRTYSAEPATCATELVWMAVIASCLVPRCASPKLVNDVPSVATTGITWKAMRKIVPGSRYLIGMCRGCR